MPRAARKKSSTGIYHVMLRGINHQVIFEDEEDYEKFLYTLKKYQEKNSYTIYAWCLMDNHIHLLVKELDEGLGIAFRRIGASYVSWYNQKYSRRGHLFQDRFKSEAVESDRYFAVVVRYIHQNPVKAHLVKDIADYKWSSYREFIEKPWLCETETTLRLFSSDKARAVKLFKEFNLAKHHDECLSYQKSIRLTDAEGIEVIKSLTDGKSPASIQNLGTAKRNEIIRACKEKGLSFRQISRLTGISFGVIRFV